MNKIVVFFLLFVFILGSCNEKTVYDKPKKLIKEKEMINMLTDLHMAESTFLHFRNDTTYKNITTSVYYYSILDKYQVPDSVFERSFVYYASKPRNFEKMYRKVMNNISELELKYSDRNMDPIEIDPSYAR